MELQLDSGIDRCLSSVMGWMKVILKGGQKRSDFSTDLPPEKQYTPACFNVSACICVVGAQLFDNDYSGCDDVG